MNDERKKWSKQYYAKNFGLEGVSSIRMRILIWMSLAIVLSFGI